MRPLRLTRVRQLYYRDLAVGPQGGVGDAAPVSEVRHEDRGADGGLLGRQGGGDAAAFAVSDNHDQRELLGSICDLPGGCLEEAEVGQDKVLFPWLLGLSEAVVGTLIPLADNAMQTPRCQWVVC